MSGRTRDGGVDAAFMDAGHFRRATAGQTPEPARRSPSVNALPVPPTTLDAEQTPPTTPPEDAAPMPDDTAAELRELRAQVQALALESRTTGGKLDAAVSALTANTAASNAVVLQVATLVGKIEGSQAANSAAEALRVDATAAMVRWLDKVGDTVGKSKVMGPLTALAGAAAMAGIGVLLRWMGKL